MMLRSSLIFHVFEIFNFDLLIGYPIEKLFFDVPRTWILDIRLGKFVYSVPISWSKNSLMEPVPESEPIEKVLAISPHDSSESLLLKPIHPHDLRFSSNPSFGSIMCFAIWLYRVVVFKSDQPTDDEATRLTAMLENHWSILGCSLQDLKGISPRLCTHSITLEPSCAPPPRAAANAKQCDERSFEKRGLQTPTCRDNLSCDV